MNKGKYVFRQMCEFLPRDSFEWYVKKYKGNARIRTFSCYQHLLVMVLGQLWQCRSLGVLVNVLNSLGSALYQMGIRVQSQMPTAIVIAGSLKRWPT